MTPAEAAQLIDAIAESIRRDPGQFNFAVNVTGTRVSVTDGRTGMVVSAQGGGPGSQTTGFVSSASTGDVEMRRVDLATGAALTDLYGTLKELAQAVEAPDEGRIGAILRKLRSLSVVPAMVLDTVKSTLELADITGVT